MGAWYWIGVCAGLGAAAGVLLAGLAGRAVLVAVIAAVAGVGIGFAVRDWQSGGWADVALGAVGGLLGGLGAAPIVRGALGRGGTRGATGVLVGAAALVVGGLAWVPAVGYLEALALPVLASRLRKRAPERYAGLRTLARD
jgi:hypothetical protein